MRSLYDLVGYWRGASGLASDPFRVLVIDTITIQLQSQLNGNTDPVGHAVLAREYTRRNSCTCWRNLCDRSNVPRWSGTSFAGGTLFSASVPPAFSNSSDRPPKSKESGAAAITTAGCHDHAGEPFDGRSRTRASYLVRLAERTPGLPEHGADRVRADSSTVSFTRSPSPCADSPNTSSSAPTLRGARPVPSTSVRAGSGGGSSSHRRSLRGLPIERWPRQVELSHPEVPE